MVNKRPNWSVTLTQFIETHAKYLFLNGFFFAQVKTFFTYRYQCGELRNDGGNRNALRKPTT